MSTGNACFTLEPSFSPLNYPGLVAWYNASSAILSNASFIIGLRDLSVNANILVASNGTVSKNINDSLGIPYTSNLHINISPLEFRSEPSGLTLFLVATNNTDNEDSQNYLSIFEDQNNNPIKIGIDNIESNIYIKSDQLGSIVTNIVPNTSNIINALCFNSNITIDDDAFSSAVVYQNGKTAYYINSNTILTINKDINTFNITIGDDGADNEAAPNPLNSTIYEIIIYNHILSESTISDINRYLGEKYNIPLENSGNFNYKQNI
jgi:hypothetical protein